MLYLLMQFLHVHVQCDLGSSKHSRLVDMSAPNLKEAPAGSDGKHEGKDVVKDKGVKVYLDQKGLLNMFIPLSPHHEIYDIHVPTRDGKDKLVRGVAHPDHSLNIVVNLESQESFDMWQYLDGPVPGSPIAYAMKIGSPLNQEPAPEPLSKDNSRWDI